MPHGFLTGLLSGFNEQTAKNRAESQAAEDEAFKRDQDIATTLLTHSERPEVQAGAMQALGAMNRGEYRPKNGLARFLGGTMPNAMTPEMSNLMALVRGKSAGAPTTGGPDSAPAPAGATAAMPAETVGERGGTTGATPAPSAPAGAPTGAEAGPTDLPTTGLSAMPGAPPPPTMAPSSVTPKGTGAEGVNFPRTGAPTATTARMAATPQGAPGAPGSTTMSGGSLGFSAPPPPQLAPGQPWYTPQQTADLNSLRQARQQSLQRGADYQAGHDRAVASLQASHPELSPQEIEEQAHMEGLRWAGLPYAHLQMSKVDTIDESGNPITSLRTFDPISGTVQEIGRVAGRPQATSDRLNHFAAFLGPEMPPGATPQYIAAHATPEQRQREETAWLQTQSAQAAQKAYGTASVQPYNVQTAGGGENRVFPPAPAPVTVGGSTVGAPPPPTAPAAAAAPPPAGPAAPVPGGGGITAADLPPVPANAPKVGEQVGSSPGHPEAPVANPPATPGAPTTTTPTGVSQPAPAAGGQAPAAGPRTVQTKPDVAVDLNQISRVGATGARYIDGSTLSGVQKTIATRDAANAGIRVLDKSQADALGEFQKARANILNYTKQLLPYLAKTPAGRIKTNFNNWLGEISQSNPALAAMKAEWTTAIDTVRGPQMRITFPEITKALQGLPDDGDTIETAVRKLQNITAMFDRAENAVLPPPLEVMEAARKGTLQPGQAYQLQSGPMKGEEWGLFPDGVFRNLGKKQ